MHNYCLQTELAIRQARRKRIIGKWLERKGYITWPWQSKRTKADVFSGLILFRSKTLYTYHSIGVCCPAPQDLVIVVQCIPGYKKRKRSKQHDL
jgi:hypothetical protein